MDVPGVTYLIIGSSYAFAAALQPGPFQTYLISQTLTNGWRRTFPAVFAPILSDLPILCTIPLLLRRIPGIFLDAFQIAGGFLLFYLATGAFRAYRTFQERVGAGERPAHRTLLKAALVNFLNPNPYLSWTMILGPLLLRAWDRAPADGIGFLVAFYGTMVVASTAILFLFTCARTLGPRITRMLVAVSAAALCLFGIYQLWSGSASILRRF